LPLRLKAIINYVTKLLTQTTKGLSPVRVILKQPQTQNQVTALDNGRFLDGFSRQAQLAVKF
jgi:hypothetical protein